MVLDSLYIIYSGVQVNRRAGVQVYIFPARFRWSQIHYILYIQVCRLTGGQVFKYTYFQLDLDGPRFIIYFICSGVQVDRRAGVQVYIFPARSRWSQIHYILYIQVCRLTGGQVFKYTYFQPDLDGHRFISDLRHNISR